MPVPVFAIVKSPSVPCFSTTPEIERSVPAFDIDKAPLLETKPDTFKAPEDWLVILVEPALFLIQPRRDNPSVDLTVTVPVASIFSALSTPLSLSDTFNVFALTDNNPSPLFALPRLPEETNPLILRLLLFDVIDVLADANPLLIAGKLLEPALWLFKIL